MIQIEPKALYQFTGDQLLEFAEHIITKTLEHAAPAVKAPKEMCTRQVKQHLLEKGFKVSSPPSFQKLVEALGLTRRKQGNEYWYVTEEVEAISSRLLKK